MSSEKVNRDSTEKSGSRRGSNSRDRRQRGYVDKRDKNPETFTQIYIAKLNQNTNEDDLRQQFQKYGEIKDLVLKKFYAFIDYRDHTAAEEAIRDMNGKSFVNGEELVVE